MALTQATVTHTFKNPDGTAASGKVSFELTKRLSNGTQTVVPGEVVAALDGTGAISATLYSTVDAGTVPTDSQWICTLRLLGVGLETFSIVVPAGGGNVDLATLLPQVGTGG